MTVIVQASGVVRFMVRFRVSVTISTFPPSAKRQSARLLYPFQKLGSYLYSNAKREVRGVSIMISGAYEVERKGEVRSGEGR